MVEFEEKRRDFRSLPHNVTEDILGVQTDCIVSFSSDIAHDESPLIRKIDECYGCLDATLDARPRIFRTSAAD